MLSIEKYNNSLKLKKIIFDNSCLIFTNQAVLYDIQNNILKKYFNILFNSQKYYFFNFFNLVTYKENILGISDFCLKMNINNNNLIFIFNKYLLNIKIKEISYLNYFYNFYSNNYYYLFYFIYLCIFLIYKLIFKLTKLIY